VRVFVPGLWLDTVCVGVRATARAGVARGGGNNGSRGKDRCDAHTAWQVARARRFVSLFQGGPFYRFKITRFFVYNI